MYDVVFISYGEPGADSRYSHLKTRVPGAKRIDGVKGIHNAHMAAAKLCFTKMFWVVDGDAVVTDNFDFTWKPTPYDLEYVHIFRAINPVNELQYGYGGLKLLPRKATMEMDLNSTDMTTSIGKGVKIVNITSNVTQFNTDPYNAWKGAFREAVKLSSGVIKNQDANTEFRLKEWCSAEYINREHGKYVIEGAQHGKEWAKENQDKLHLINDFDWLQKKYNEYYTV